MIKLIKLELQSINLHPYYISSMIFGIILFVFIYFVAYVAQVQQETQFMISSNIFKLTNIISIILFSILSATMYTKLITKEYSGKRQTLLSSYSVSRKKIFIAKVFIVFCFISISMLLCTEIPIIIFSLTESFLPIVKDVISTNLLINEFKLTVVSIIAISAIGLLAFKIGFIKKSISITLISAFILSAVYGNISIDATENSAILFSVICVSLIVIIAVLVTMLNKINQMEIK